MSNGQGWENAYRRRPSGKTEPDINVVNAAEMFKNNGVNRILDLGCGDGRHLI